MSGKRGPNGPDLAEGVAVADVPEGGAGINYVGHAVRWDRIETDGDPAKCDFSARFMDGDRAAAVATIYRDVESLKAEAEMEARAG